LEHFLHSWIAPLAVNVQIHTWANLPNLLPHADLLVNTTPIGMSPHVDRSPLNAKEAECLAPNAIVYDLIYTPSPTVFLQQAAEQGAIAIDGLEMLVQQGAAALEIWLQQPVSVDVMRRSLKQHLGL
jgi:shikimate dehydrogenase